MRDVSCLMGPKELENIKKHAANSLDAEEWAFVKSVDEKIDNFINEKGDKFLGFDEIVRLREIEEKYQYLKPFVFLFDPNKSMPEVAQNRTAFIIWTIWRSNHILGSHEDLNGAVLATANILNGHCLPYSSEAKEEAVRVFTTKMEMTGGNMGNAYSKSSSFWHSRIFPYLEGILEFKWELAL